MICKYENYKNYENYDRSSRENEFCDFVKIPVDSTLKTYKRRNLIIKEI